MYTIVILGFLLLIAKLILIKIHVVCARVIQREFSKGIICKGVGRV